MDQIEELPECNWSIVLVLNSCLTYRIEDQKIDLVPLVVAVQKEELGKYLALRTEMSKGFLLVAML